MTDAPERIWLQWGGPCGENTFCEDQINNDDVEYIRADLAPSTPAPVTVQEAARVLAKCVAERAWTHYPIEMPVTKDGKGPARIGDDADVMTYEVWDAVTFATLSSHDKLPDAIEAWLHALADLKEKSDG